MENYQSEKKYTIEIIIYDYNFKILTDANLELICLNNKKSFKVKFNRQWNSYSIDVDLGKYLIIVDHQLYESQEKKISVTNEGLMDKIVLGKKGMLYYYRGSVKIPFNPYEDFLGVSLKPDLSKKEIDELLRFIENLDMSRIKVDETIDPSKMMVIKFKESTNSHDKLEKQLLLSKYKFIALVGPIVHLSNRGLAFLTNQAVIKFRKVVPIDINKILSQYGLKIVRQIPYMSNGFLVSSNELANYALLTTLAKILERKDIESAEPNLVISSIDLSYEPIDHLYDEQWTMNIVHLPHAWKELQAFSTAVTFGSPNVIIAVMDKGIEKDHPDFDGNLRVGELPKIVQLYDFIRMRPDNDMINNEGHGMACAGVASARINNPPYHGNQAEGMVGAVPACRIMGLIRPESGHSTDMKYADAFVWTGGFDPGWVVDLINYPAGTVFPPVPIHPADIITNSFELPFPTINTSLIAAINKLTSEGRRNKGTLLFCAAGNDNGCVSNSGLASHPKMMVVAASCVDLGNEVKAEYSNHGTKIDFCAPSSKKLFPVVDGIISCSLTGQGNIGGSNSIRALDYRNDFDGTSASTPLVSGIAALILSVNPDLTWAEVRTILRVSAEKIDPLNQDLEGRWYDRDRVGINSFSQWYGYGRIDALNAIRFTIANMPGNSNETVNIADLVAQGYKFDKFKLATSDQNNTAVCVFVASRNDAGGALLDRKILLSPMGNTGPYVQPSAILHDPFIVLDANVGDVHYLDTFISPINTVFCVFCYHNTNLNEDHFVITRSEGTYGSFFLCSDLPLQAGFQSIEAKMLNHRIVFVVVDQANDIKAIASDAGH